MKLKSTLFALALMLGLVASSMAQDTDKRKEKQFERATKNTSKQLMKYYGPAKLTDEQKEKATEVIEKHVKKLVELRRAQEGLLSADQRKMRKEAVTKAKADGLKGQKMAAAGFKAMGLTEDEKKEFDKAKKAVNSHLAALRSEINKNLSEDQVASLKKRKGKQGQGKRGKKKPDGDGSLQLVSVKLPGMTCANCAASVQASLGGIDGITNVKMDIETKSCTFSAPAKLDVDKTLNELAKANSRMKAWTRK